MKRLHIGVLLILSIVSLLPNWFVIEASHVEPQSSDGARRISPADLRALLKKDQAIIVDVRTAEAYKAGHIKGALSIPAGEIANRSEDLPKDKLIATYCS